MYKAENIDTDKMLKAISECRQSMALECINEVRELQKYYEGIDRGLAMAAELFHCTNYEKDNTSDTDHQIPTRSDTLMGIRTVFALGMIFSTPAIATERRRNLRFNDCVERALYRYGNADWSDMESLEDRAANDAAVISGNERIFASYDTVLGKIYIVTESDHSVTRIMFADEFKKGAI